MNDPRRILEDDPSESERALLGSARLDTPPAASKARVIAAFGFAAVTTTAATGGATAPAATGVSLALKWLTIGAIGGAVTWVAVQPTMSGSPRSPGRPAPASLSVPPAAEARAGTAASAPAEAPLAPPAAPAVEVAIGDGKTTEPVQRPARLQEVVATKSARTATAPPPASAVSDPQPGLAAEVTALGEARRALASGQASTTLGLLDAYDRRFAQPTLAPEATVLRIEALIALGRVDEARGLASRMLAAQQDSPYAQRVRSLIGNATSRIP